MIDLQHKYRQNRLTPMELLELKKRVNALSDDQLSDSIREGWMHDAVDTSLVEQDRTDALRRRIHRQIKHHNEPEKGQVRPLRPYRWLHIAAAVLVALFFVSTVYLYHENKQLAAKRMVVSTGIGERANVTLPDGTRVKLNAESQLSYAPQTYNKDVRQVAFNGEGFYEVAKDSSRPFLIDARGLKVQVFGTKFNLMARDDEATAELVLEQGSVSFTAVKTGERVMLKPEQKVVLNQCKGSLTVVDLSHMQDVAAWKRHEMVFRNIPLEDVIAAIEKIYGVEFITDSKRYLKETFTGTIPTTDINDDLQILEKAFHFKIMMKEGKVFISSKKSVL